MAIKRLEISGYRSIDNINIEAKQIVGLIGQNGSGKSNILSALNYFYKNLISEWDEKGIFDTYNSFRNEVCICITYDLKNILKISQHNLNGIEEEHKGYEKFYQKIQGISRNDEVILELRKRKGRPAVWNVSYNIRQIIAAVFPVYFVDARQIMLTDWTNLWNLIGDLLKLQNEESSTLRNNITEMVMKCDPGTANKIQQLKAVLNEKMINVRQLTPGELGKIISEIVLGGQMFQYGERNLKEHSNGTNAFNYTLFLIEILNLIKLYKLKEPVVILDEPEISLHNVMIDLLMERIIVASEDLQFFLSTHSSRCVKDIMEEEMDCAIYHVALKGKYSNAKKVKNLSNQEFRERVIISETYTNTCFAKMVVNVEGETEIELLKNKYLREVFPCLKNLEIVKGMSNQTVANLATPDKRNYQTPCISVIDMDKVLEKKRDNSFHFVVLKDCHAEKEVYYYGNKRKDTLYLRKRIENMCGKCHFSYELPLYSCSDPNFECLLMLVCQYYENYHFFVWKNTIEGALITVDNKDLLCEFVRESALIQKRMKDVSWYLSTRNPNEQLNYLRLVFSGKSDFLLTKKQIRTNNPRIDSDIEYNLGSVDKTSGWVSQWMEYYFLRIAGIDRDDPSKYRRFCRWIRKEGAKEKAVMEFQLDFRELYALLKRVEIEKNRDDFT